MLSVSWEDRDDNLWIELIGEMDHDQCLRIREEFQGRLEKGDGDVIVVMNDVTFLSSMGMGMLVGANEQLRKQGRSLKLSGVPGKIRKVLDETNLLGVFSLL